MPIAPSPLEVWFTTHPGPYAHMLGSTAAMAPSLAEVTALAGDWPSGVGLGYGEPLGDPALREFVAGAYGVPAASVMLAQGAVEANWLALAALLRPGDSVVVQRPIYPQLPLVAEALGATVRDWPTPLDPAEPADLEALAALVDASTRLIVINSPHNPTGRVFSETELARIGAIASSVGASWLVDEVYRGVGPAPLPGSAVRHGAIVTGSTSKGWALPGLRLGWLVAPAEVVEGALRWREHTALALSGLSEALARSLWPRHDELVRANQAIVSRNQGIAREWLSAHPRLVGRLSDATAIMLLSTGDRDDVALAERWHAEDRVLAIPGSLVGCKGMLRVGLGHRDPAALEAALAFLASKL